MNDNNKISQVKICGLTRASEARKCVALGVSAIGCVFYPPSPRHLTPVQALRICEILPSTTVTVGVFVNASFDYIMKTVRFCSLKAVQLHGQEPRELVEQLRHENLTVIKALFINRSPFLTEADDYKAAAYLVECGRGQLPGGNAVKWNWRQARATGQTDPLILAGGLTPENVAIAMAACEPDALDVSSGVESAPGRKDPAKVKAFMDEVARCRVNKNIRRIF